MKTVSRANDIKIVKGKYYGNGRTDGEGFEYNLIHVIDVDRDYNIAVSDVHSMIKDSLDGKPNTWSPVITYQFRGEIKSCTELEFKQLLEVDGFKDVTATVEMQKKAENNKLTNPNYLAASKLIGHTIASPDGKYQGTVDQVNLNSYTSDVKVKIKVLGLDVESSFYRSYPLTDFNLEKIFTPTEVNKLNAIYGPSSDEALLAIAVAKKLDQESEEKFWKEMAERGKEFGMTDEMVQIAKNTVKFLDDIEKDKNKDGRIEIVPANSNDWLYHTSTKENVEKLISYVDEMRQLKDEKEFVDLSTNEELGHIDAKTDGYTERPKKVEIEKQSLFEVVGVWKHNKDEKFTVIGEDINAELIAKIQFGKPEMQVYSIKRISTIDVM